MVPKAQKQTKLSRNELCSFFERVLIVHSNFGVIVRNKNTENN